jgi:hypothetical protein
MPKDYIGPDEEGDSESATGDSTDYAAGAEQMAFRKLTSALGVKPDDEKAAYKAFQRAVRACIDAYGGVEEASE